MVALVTLLLLPARFAVPPTMFKVAPKLVIVPVKLAVAVKLEVPVTL